MSSLLTRSAAKPPPKRTVTDLIIDVTTPVMIFIMVQVVITFLMDVRWIVTAVHDPNLRFVAFVFVLGVVALNRLIARDGSDESYIYAIGLAAAIGIYTVATTNTYGVGAIAGGNGGPWLDLAINMSVVVFVWWLVNRLTHECCVDEDPAAGDIGILTGTARQLRGAIRTGDENKKKGKSEPIFKLPSKKKPETRQSFLLQTEIESFDPTEGRTPMDNAAPDLKKDSAPSKRLAKRHPGISILYFSVPVLVAFALGLRWTQHAGETFVLRGQLLMAIYCVCALSLLMLTSLGGLREYFRTRGIEIPSGIGPFWIAVGLLMMFMVLFGALAPPMPELPPIARVESRVYDEWNRGDTFAPIQVVVTQAEQAQQNRIITYSKWTAVGCFAALGIYALIRAIGELAMRIAKQRHRFPPWVIRFFDWLDRILQRLTTLPQLPSLIPRFRRRWVDRKTALCTQYMNPLAKEDRHGGSTHVLEVSFDALCALAHDLGVPRRIDETPYEFMENFPKELRPLKKDAFEMIDMYVASAFNGQTYTERELDRVRKFWMRYEKLRSAVLR